MVKFYLKGHAREDIAQIRTYTIKTWGNEQWLKYKDALFRKLQTLADNPSMGLVIPEVSDNAFRFPLENHVVYYLKRDHDVVFVGVISNNLAPVLHTQREQDLAKEENKHRK